MNLTTDVTEGKTIEPQEWEGCIILDWCELVWTPNFEGKYAKCLRVARQEKIVTAERPHESYVNGGAQKYI